MDGNQGGYFPTIANNNNWRDIILPVSFKNAGFPVAMSFGMRDVSTAAYTSGKNEIKYYFYRNGASTTEPVYYIAAGI